MAFKMMQPNWSETANGDGWLEKKSFLLYILEKNILNKTWRTPSDKIFLFVMIFL